MRRYRSVDDMIERAEQNGGLGRNAGLGQVLKDEDLYDGIGGFTEEYIPAEKRGTDTRSPRSAISRILDDL